MRPRSFLPVALLVALIALLAAAGCSRRAPVAPDLQPPHDHGDDVPLSDGLWLVTHEVTALTGDSTCAAENGTSQAVYSVHDGHIEGGYFGESCHFHVHGSHFEQTCTDSVTMTDSCSVIVTTTGEGNVAGDTFTATYTVGFENVGSCDQFGLSDCTYRIVASGVKMATPAPDAPRARRLPPVPHDRVRGLRELLARAVLEPALRRAAGR
jgi:hypothetical protein